MSPSEATFGAATRWYWWAFPIALGGYLALIFASGNSLLALPIAAAVGAVALVMAAVRPVPMLALTLLAFGVAGLSLGTSGVDVGIRIYYADIVLILLLAATLIGPLLAPESWNHDWPSRAPFALLLAFLALSLVHGVAVGNELRLAFGDFRRMAIYPLALVIAAGAIRCRRDIELLLGALVFAAYGTTCIEIWRVITGVGYLEGTLTTATIRYLSYVEAATAAVGVLILVGYARHGRHRRAALLGALPLLATVLFSNYRTAWGALILGLLLQALALGMRRAVRALLLALVIVPPLVAALVFWTPLGAFVMDRFDLLDVATSGSWRLFSWMRVFEVWRDHPLLGTGLGYFHRFEVFKLTTGEMFSDSGNAIHNDTLWFLVNNGLVGVAVGLGFLIPVLRRAFRLAESRDDFAKQIGSTAIGAAAIFVSTSMLQPFFSTAGTTAILAAMFAMVLRLPTEAAQ